ncbi:hypothetical protein BEP19_12730 [Ammoniphilus oxalaticus]|uniref:TATA-box binding n=1 Tax=Ammoniphilus oxalaticus TaxID=66863 RepID=A0A419SH17_9BACL|nr:YwmB family TATA-box binding protein [Ammoniphilus oxalaticus]RKD23084.1 hypothetical protein BEP19_12730 [Ammoniphilus oxalaticus]
MKKYRGIQFLLCSVMMVFGLTVFAEQQQEKQDPAAAMRDVDKLVDIMEQTGIELEHIQLHDGIAHQTFEQWEEAQAFATRIGQAMGLALIEQPSPADIPNAPTSTAFHFEEQTQQQHQDEHTANKTARTMLRVIATPQEAGWDTYLTINIQFDATNDRDQTMQQLEIVFKALENEQIVPQFDTCTQGIINDKLTDDIQIKKLNKLLDLLGAQVVEKVEDPTVKSLSAYSPDFPFYIWTNGKKMNLQAATHVDHLNSQTRITVGTPIITIEY